jgi:hypothetical protein
MPVPFLGRALRGWTRSTTINLVTKTVVDYEVEESEIPTTLQANFQPMPAAQVNRKPEEQRTWKWWSIIVKDKTVLFQTDDVITDAEGTRFRIEKANDWRESGFTKYEAVEDYA